MATPVPTVEIAFGANWDDTGVTFVDVSTSVDAWSADRKYGWETNAYQGGRATIVLSDKDRTYDPFHASGPYYEDITPGTPVQISEDRSAVDKLLWCGFVDKVTRGYAPHGYGVTTLSCVDVWSKVAALSVTTSRVEETTGNRAQNILAAYLPAAFFVVTTPTPATMMPAKTYDGVPLATVLSGVADAEAGMVWVDKFGVLTVAGRHYPASSRMLTDQATLSDVAADSSVIRYAPATVEWDFGDIVNSVTATRSGGSSVTVEDASSIARYGRASKSFSSLEVVDDIQAIANANRFIAQRKDPLPRLPPLTFDVIDTGLTAHEHACERDVWDRVRWKMTPYGGGSVEDRDAFITGVSHSWTANAGNDPQWFVTWDLIEAGLFDRLDPANWARWGGTYSQWGGTYAASDWAY